VLVEVGDISLAYRFVVVGFSLQILQQLTALMRVMNVLNRLLQPNGDEQSDDDGGVVD
jgi:hypothetical protein